LAVIVDTGPLLSAAHRRDEAYGLAVALIDLAARDLVVPDPVVVECDYLLRERVGPHAARGLLDALVSGAWRRGTLSPSVFARAVAIDARYADLGLGIADASVMALAESTRGVILTFDFAHFRAAPPLDGGTWDLLVSEAEFARMVRT